MEPSSRPLYLVCTRKTVATYYAIFLSENMWQYGKEWMEMWFVSRWHGSQIIWHKTGMSQHCHLTHPHANTWLCKYVSNNIMLSETYFPLMSTKYNIQRSVHKHAMTILKCKHATTTHHIKRSNIACLVRSSQSLTVWSLRLRCFLRNLRYKKRYAHNVNTVSVQKSDPNIFQINMIKN